MRIWSPQWFHNFEVHPRHCYQNLGVEPFRSTTRQLFSILPGLDQRWNVRVSMKASMKFCMIGESIRKWVNLQPCYCRPAFFLPVFDKQRHSYEKAEKGSAASISFSGLRTGHNHVSNHVLHTKNQDLDQSFNACSLVLKKFRKVIRWLPGETLNPRERVDRFQRLLKSTIHLPGFVGTKTGNLKVSRKRKASFLGKHNNSSWLVLVPLVWNSIRSANNGRPEKKHRDSRQVKRSNWDMTEIPKKISLPFPVDFHTANQSTNLWSPKYNQPPLHSLRWSWNLHRIFLLHRSMPGRFV